jgi:hypothetical protein
MPHDPTFPRRNPDPPELPNRDRAWTLLIGVLVVGGLIAFLASGKSHNGTVVNSSTAPVANSTINPPPAETPGAILPAARSPIETTGSAPRGQ